MTRVRQVKASEPPRHARRNEGELGRKVAEEVPLTALPLASLVGVCFLSMTLSQRVSPAAMSTVHETVQIRLAVGFRLDSLWAETMGIDPSDTKERPLRLVAELLNRAGVAYALIGGVAVQIHTTEPRTTLDIDVAVPRFTDVPRAELLAAGFDHTGRHELSDNWHAPPAGPGSLRTTVQFSAEVVGIADAVSHAELTDLAGKSGTGASFRSPHETRMHKPLPSPISFCGYATQSDVCRDRRMRASCVANGSLPARAVATMSRSAGSW